MAIIDNLQKISDTVRELPPKRADRIVCETLLCFQRYVTAAALTINAHQNFLVRFQLLADRKQIFRVFCRLLVVFL